LKAGEPSGGALPARLALTGRRLAYALWTCVDTDQKVLRTAAPGAFTTCPSQMPYQSPKMVLPEIVTLMGVAADHTRMPVVDRSAVGVTSWSPPRLFWPMTLSRIWLPPM
jgi:hypothetical protein